jgi:hypothetical protein
MTSHRRANTAGVLCIAAVILSAVAIPAQAGSVRIGAIHTGGANVSLPFSVTCIAADQAESKPVNYSVWTGSSTVIDGCNKFAIYFTAPGGARYDYQMFAGHSYYFQWTGSRWDFYEN